MSLEANKYRLGLFFSLGSLMFIVAIIWLTGGFREPEIDRYVSYYSWSVQGLNSGSNVMYNGVPVGRVSGISIVPNSRLVEVTMEIESSFHMDSTITASLQLVGITGIKTVNLRSNPEVSTQSISHPEYPSDTPYPIIPVEAGTMESVESGLERLLQIMYEIDFQKISDQTVSLLQNMNTLLESEKLDSLLTTLQSSSEKLDTLLTTYNRLGRSLLELSGTLNREAPLFTEDIHTLAIEIEQMTEMTDVLITGTDELVFEAARLFRDLRELVNVIRNDPTGLLMRGSGEDIWQ
jgi:phospholipid/cholesterol/gamma-HCH transport system substrate-binding protein